MTIKKGLSDRTDRYSVTKSDIELLRTPSEVLRERTYVFSFEEAPFIKRMKGEPWQQVLQSHLYFDHVITAILSEELKDPDSINVKRMGFTQKIQLIKAMGLLPSALIPPIAVVNRLRNRLAHDLAAEISNEEVNQLRNALPASFKALMEPGLLISKDALLNMLVYLLFHVEECRQHNAFRRISQRKAHLNAARVLDDLTLEYVE